MANLERAIEIAFDAHKEQERRDGQPYVVHPIRVLGKLAIQGFSETVQIVGILHDVVEDSEEWTIQRLREEGFEEDILEALELLDKNGKDETEYIDAIARNDIARPVKIADMEDNLEDDPSDYQVEKYTRRLARIAYVAMQLDRTRSSAS